MPTIFRSLRLPVLCLALAASAQTIASPVLPTPLELDGAIKRAIDTLTKSLDPQDPAHFSQAMMLGRVRSADVMRITGCVEGAPSTMTCIAQLDWGMGKQGYVAVPISRQGGQWGAPALAEHLRDSVAPQPPSPNAAQAQAAARQYAQAQVDENGPDGDLEVIATGLEVISISDNCKIDSSDGSVGCEAAFKRPATKSAPEQEYAKRSYFYLDGLAWRFGRPESE